MRICAVERKAENTLILPQSVVSLSDVRRTGRELESLDEFITQAAIRTAGKQPVLPKISKMLDDLAKQNGFNLLLEGDRRQARDFLRAMQKAPVIHISFASDPPAAFLSKIVHWFRKNIDPYTLLQIGLQPTIAAGCVVRTPNRVLDFSLRKRFYENRAVLLKSLEQLQ